MKNFLTFGEESPEDTGCTMYLTLNQKSFPDTTVLRTFLISLSLLRPATLSWSIFLLLAWHLLLLPKESSESSPLSYIEEFAFDPVNPEVQIPFIATWSAKWHTSISNMSLLRGPNSWVSVIEFILHGLQWSNHPYVPSNHRPCSPRNKLSESCCLHIRKENWWRNCERWVFSSFVLTCIVWMFYNISYLKMLIFKYVI